MIKLRYLAVMALTVFALSQIKSAQDSLFFNIQIQQTPIVNAAENQNSTSVDSKLLQLSDLKYLGAFRVSQGEFGSPQYSGFN